MASQSGGERLPTLEEALAKWHIIGEIYQVYHARRRDSEKPNDEALRIVPLSRVLVGPTVWNVADLFERMEWVLRLQERPETPVSVLRLNGYEISQEDLLAWSDLCTGGDLFERVVSSPDGHYNEADAQVAIKALLAAVVFAHKSACVIHRDIKPARFITLENVLYRTPESDVGDLVLIDYGCSLLQADRQKTYSGHVGSPGYMSPEMCAGLGHTMMTDEYSLGVTCYEILVGRSPIVGETAEELLQATVEQPVFFPPDYWRQHSKLARDFVLRLMTKDPKHRMTVEEAVDHPWFAYDPLANEEGSQAEDSSATASDTDVDLDQMRDYTTRATSLSSMHSLRDGRSIRITRKPVKEDDIAPEVVESEQHSLSEKVTSIVGALPPKPASAQGVR